MNDAHFELIVNARLRIDRERLLEATNNCRAVVAIIKGKHLFEIQRLKHLFYALLTQAPLERGKEIKRLCTS